MSLGKTVRLNRLFSHPSGRLCSVALDHFIGYGAGLPRAIETIAQTLKALAEGKPDAMTMHRGIAKACWKPYAGRIPLIMQSTLLRVGEPNFQQIASAEDAVRIGADAMAMVAYVRGKDEVNYMKSMADCARDGERFDMPVIVHIYPRLYENETIGISYRPDDIAWAVHVALECGVDVIKVPYCNDLEAYKQIVENCPVPVVAAGGPQTKTLGDALETLSQVVQSGARGAVIGRNAWSAPDVAAAVRAFKAVVHDEKSPADVIASLPA